MSLNKFKISTLNCIGKKVFNFWLNHFIQRVFTPCTGNINDRSCDIISFSGGFWQNKTVKVKFLFLQSSIYVGIALLIFFERSKLV